jgi:hypothetical protein
MAGGQITSLTRANKTSESLRTTVPASVIKQFSLKDGDKLRWRFEGEKGGIYLRVEPVKE